MPRVIWKATAGLPTRGTSAESLRRCAHALDLFHTQRGDPSADVERLLSDDPTCLAAHCLRVGLAVRGDDFMARDRVATSIAAIESACPNDGDPARRHAAAARAWLDGDAAGALDRYGAIVIDSPVDLLALVVAHALDFRLGRRRMLRDRVAQVLPAWNVSMRGYASVLAIYAFGLEENAHYRRAERVARSALTLDPGHPAAIHALAHVMEMKGRAREGLAFLAATAPSWAQGTGFSVHLAWHQALFHLDADGPEAALTLYDARIAPARDSLAALADASALLWRLTLRGADVGSRWESLANRWQMQSVADARPFYAVHALMAFAAAGHDGATARVLDALRSTHAHGPPEDALAPTIGEALLAFARRNYTACIDWIARVRHLAQRCGGSVAQCDLIHLTLTEAALRAHKARLARTLAEERAAQKPASVQNQLLLWRAGMLMPAVA